VDAGSTFTFYVPKSYPAPMALTPVKPFLDSMDLASGQLKKVGEADRFIEQRVSQDSLLWDEARRDIGDPESDDLLDENGETRDALFANSKVLIIDDDLRNIFAVTSVLERYNLGVVFAENGPEGIEALKNDPDIDCVLMDVMMPDLDGYEATRQIRRMAQFKDLPIIALTARAMKGDREKCLEAGASDYISKPVDPRKLVATVRSWISRRVRAK
jgi:CheY-like chemotaxis protein